MTASAERCRARGLRIAVKKLLDAAGPAEASHRAMATEAQHVNIVPGGAGAGAGAGAAGETEIMQEH